MKKWKLIRKITGIIILLFLLLIAFLLIKNYFNNVSYPRPMNGIDAYNWFDAFIIETTISFYLLGIPLLIDVLIFIVSIFKLKDDYKNKK